MSSAPSTPLRRRSRPEAHPRPAPVGPLRGLVGATGLDAALLLAAWTALLQTAAGGSGWQAPLLAGLAASLAYLGDHLLDARRLGNHPDLSDRHRFAQRHRRGLELTWILALALGAATSLRLLPSAVFLRGAVLAFGAIIYLLACRRWPRRLRSWPPRELAVGLFFALGVGVLVTPMPGVGALFLFGAICSLNALAVAGRDLARDRAVGEVSSVTRWPGLRRWFPALALGLVGVALGSSVLGGVSGLVSSAVAVAAALLAGTESTGRRPYGEVDRIVTFAAVIPLLLHHVL